MRALVLVLSLCVAGAAAAEPANYRRAIAAAIQDSFRDPSSIRDAQITPPAPRFMGAATRTASCIKINAKNGFGGYTGAVDYVAIFADGGRLLGVQEDITSACFRATGYQPFPEAGRRSAANR